MKTLVTLLAVGFIGFGIWYYMGESSTPTNTSIDTNNTVTVVDFITCAEAGNAVMPADRSLGEGGESYPRQCRSAEGELFVENIGNILEKRDLITVQNIGASSVVESPLTITGQARGYWFFESSFPITVTDWNGVIIGEGYATAYNPDGGEAMWMTEDFVPFEGVVSFTVPADTPYKRGTLILQRHNASGLPEHDDALEIPVRFE